MEFWIAKHYNNRLKSCLAMVHIAITTTNKQSVVDDEIDSHCFWLDSIIKGANKDGVLAALNLPES